MEILKTSRLTLRTWTLSDVSNGFEIWGDPEVMRFVDDGTPQNLESVKKSIEAGIRHQERFGFQHWAVVQKDSGQVIGACGFNSTDQAGVIELVFHISKSYWGQGYATEAVLSCIGFAFEKIRPVKIIAGCHPENEASKKVLLKSGFGFVGKKWFEDTQREEPCFEIVK